MRFKAKTRTIFTWRFKFFSATPDDNGCNIQSVHLSYLTLMSFNLSFTSIMKQLSGELALTED